MPGRWQKHPSVAQIIEHLERHCTDARRTIGGCRGGFGLTRGAVQVLAKRQVVSRAGPDPGAARRDERRVVFACMRVPMLSRGSLNCAKARLGSAGRRAGLPGRRRTKSYCTQSFYT